MKITDAKLLAKGDPITAEWLNALLAAILAIRKLQVSPSTAGRFEFADANATLSLSLGNSPLVISGVLNGQPAYATVYGTGTPIPIVI